MAAINKVILIGNLGKDPEVRKTQGGTSVASFSIATTEKFKDRNGARQEKTEWHNIIIWDKMAELAGKYLKKGSSVYLEGKLQTSSWVDKNTQEKKYKTEIVANQMQFLGGKPENSGASRSEPSQASFGGATPPPAQAQAGFDGQTQPGIDDNLPF